jgi:hypothetical protein
MMLNMIFLRWHLRKAICYAPIATTGRAGQLLVAEL